LVFVSSVEGNYSTVDEDMPKTPKNRISMDGDYSTVELDEHLDTNCSYPENLIMFGNVTYTEKNRLILHAKLML
jgi:hypothetical protein